MWYFQLEPFATHRAGRHCDSDCASTVVSQWTRETGEQEIDVSGSRFLEWGFALEYSFLKDADPGVGSTIQTSPGESDSIYREYRTPLAAFRSSTRLGRRWDKRDLDLDRSDHARSRFFAVAGRGNLQRTCARSSTHMLQTETSHSRLFVLEGTQEAMLTHSSSSLAQCISARRFCLGNLYLPVLLAPAPESTRLTRVPPCRLEIVAALFRLLWFWLEVASMSGLPLKRLSRAAWRTVLFETQFGRVWQLRLGLIVAAFALVATGRER